MEDIVLFSDLHLHHNFTWNKEDAEIVVDAICNHNNKAETCVFDGDWYEAKDNIPHELVSATGALISKIRSRFKRFFFVPGNHDGKNMDHLGFDFAEHCFDDITVVREPLEFGGYVLMPFTPDPWQLAQWINKIEHKEQKILITHAEFKDMRLISEYNSVTTHGLDGITVRDFKMVLDGHYHIRQKNGNIETIGVPRHMSFKDCGTEPCFKVIENGVCRSIPIKGVTKFVKLPFSTNILDTINELSPDYKYKIKIHTQTVPTRETLEFLTALRSQVSDKVRGIELSHKTNRTVANVDLTKALDTVDVFRAYLDTFDNLPLDKSAYMYVVTQWLKGETVL